MAPPYSTDLRWRIMWFVITQQVSANVVSTLFNISARTVSIDSISYVNLFLQSGDVVPRTRSYGPNRLLGDYEQLILLRLIIENPGIYLEEIQSKLYEVFGVDVSAPKICRTLKIMWCSRQHIALQRCEDTRTRFMAEISIYNAAMFVWIDETGCDRRNSMRRYGYSVRGIHPCDHKLLVRGVRYSGIAVMSLEGIHDVQIVEGSVNGGKFVTNTLIPIQNPFNGTNPLSVVIMDNCSIHHIASVMNLIENVAQAKVVFLPPYSPDLMPLEEAFSKVKGVMTKSSQLL